MPDEIRAIDYYYATVPDHADPKWISFREDSAAFMQAAKSTGLILSRKKRGFLLQGDNRPGAIAQITQNLAQGNI